jgi:hypothetical protein
MMRSKFKSIENDIKSLDTDSVDIEPLKGIFKVSTDVKTLAEEKKEKIPTSIISKHCLRKGADIRQI